MREISAPDLWISLWVAVDGLRGAGAAKFFWKKLPKKVARSIAVLVTTKLTP
jgi:hypothetical protein